VTQDQGQVSGGWINVAATPCGWTLVRLEKRYAVRHRASIGRT
jgi:hypothetical protein